MLHRIISQFLGTHEVLHRSKWTTWKQIIRSPNAHSLIPLEGKILCPPSKQAGHHAALYSAHNPTFQSIALLTRVQPFPRMPTADGPPPASPHFTCEKWRGTASGGLGCLWGVKQWNTTLTYRVTVLLSHWPPVDLDRLPFLTAWVKPKVRVNSENVESSCNKAVEQMH